MGAYTIRYNLLTRYKCDRTFTVGNGQEKGFRTRIHYSNPVIIPKCVLDWENRYTWQLPIRLKAGLRNPADKYLAGLARE